jgi:hypothetical protein
MSRREDKWKWGCFGFLFGWGIGFAACWIAFFDKQ